MEPFHLHHGTALKDSSGGFTLVELLVVLAIIIVITGVVFTSQSSFNKTLILSNTAYDVALTLRSAETYGLSSRVVGSATNVGYGIHFQNGGVMTLFSDTFPSSGNALNNCHPIADPSAPNAQPGNCSYDATQSEKVIEYTLQNGITVTDICASNTSGSGSCTYAHDGYSGGLSSLDIVFARPNSDTFMSTNGAFSATIGSACIRLSSPQGGSRFVRVESSGSITANATSCP